MIGCESNRYLRKVRAVKVVMMLDRSTLLVSRKIKILAVIFHKKSLVKARGPKFVGYGNFPKGMKGTSLICWQVELPGAKNCVS